MRRKFHLFCFKVIQLLCSTRNNRHPYLASSIQHPASSIQHLVSSIQHQFPAIKLSYKQFTAFLITV